jgi:hypothetical protein
MPFQWLNSIGPLHLSKQRLVPLQRFTRPTTSNVPSRNNMQSHSSALGGEEPISAPAVAQNGRQDLRPSRLESGQTLRTKPPNAFSMDSSKPATPESQHAWETEGSDDGNPFKLLGQLVGERAPDGRAVLGAGGGQLGTLYVITPLSVDPCSSPLSFTFSFVADSWLQRSYMVLLSSSCHTLTR